MSNVPLNCKMFRFFEYKILEENKFHTDMVLSKLLKN